MRDENLSLHGEVLKAAKAKQWPVLAEAAQGQAADRASRPAARPRFPFAPGSAGGPPDVVSKLFAIEIGDCPGSPFQ